VRMKKEKSRYVSYDFIALNYIFGVPALNHLKAFKILSKTNNVDVLINEHGIFGTGKDICKLQLLLAKSVLLN
jgi:hypothetical protein